MITEPEYFGEKPAAGGVVIRCGCGNLATHQAMYMVDDGGTGRWRHDDVCEKCARDRAMSPDPPPARRAAPRLGRPRSTRPQMAARRGSQTTRVRAAVVGYLT